jgi:hypothetical protein
MNSDKNFDINELVEKGKTEGSITKAFFTNKGFSARYIKVKAYNLGVNPKWHFSAGEKSWLFIDEIIIEQ